MYKLVTPVVNVSLAHLLTDGKLQVVRRIKSDSAPAQSAAHVMRRDRPVRSTKYLPDEMLQHLQTEDETYHKKKEERKD